MQSGQVSVMMPAYNAEQYISQAIESVLSQSYPHWELIIVDDGSTDETLDRAIQYTDPRIKVIHQPNGGESSARNTALMLLQGEFIAFLDADDLFLPFHLEKTIEYLQSNTRCAAVYTDGFYVDQNGNRLQTLSSRRRGPYEGHIFEEIVYGSDVLGPPVCVVVRRNIITKYNLKFDEDITIGPDWDFFTQYSDSAEFGYLNLHTCLYRLHRDNITFRIDLQKRALEIAKCRKKAVKMINLKNCSTTTQWNVFYDLLVNSLHGFPESQSEITQWREFDCLPLKFQARLLRLMARDAIQVGIESGIINEWLRRSRQLDSTDWRGMLLFGLYRLNPYLCKRLVISIRPKNVRTSPFSDMGLAPSV
jgi:glycosyltransferase involved in cell wall biosynthesis